MHKKELIRLIQSIAGKYSAYEVFTDFIRAAALSISNVSDVRHGEVWEERERMYIDTLRKYPEEERNLFPEMLNLLIYALDDQIEDVLGSVYMEAEMGSKFAGQFFTPFHLSELSAKLAIEEKCEHFDGHVITLTEPSCGGGGLIIAAVKVMLDKGINPQKYLRVLAQDLDWKGVYMCYLQLSLLGIKATVVQGDTLSSPYVRGKTPERQILRTPCQKGMPLWR